MRSHFSYIMFKKLSKKLKSFYNDFCVYLSIFMFDVNNYLWLIVIILWLLIIISDCLWLFLTIYDYS